MAKNTEPATLDDVTELTSIIEPSDVQVACVEAAVGGRDVLAVIPTGGGKSAIYQLAGPLVEGVTIVIVPLLALATDQLRSIGETDLPSAASLDGSTGEADRAEIHEALVDGRLEYLFVTPESLQNEGLQSCLQKCSVSLFVVDEAHCVVTWGQSFRTDYLMLSDVRRALGSPTCIALTASADPRLRADLIRLLDLDDPLVTVLPLARGNIELTLSAAPTRRAAEAALLDYIEGGEGRTIVYVPTTRLCEDLSAHLTARGRRAVAYHGRLRKADRQGALDALREDEDTVVIATNAFGMGIDVPDIRTVAHLDLPATLIDYYQEVGRAGRDGKPAQCRAFVGLAKASRRTFTAGVRRVSSEDCLRVREAVRSGSKSKRSIAKVSGLSLARVTRAVTVLSMLGVLEPVGRLRLLDVAVSLEEIEAICEQREEFDRSQRDAVQVYRSVSTCRWQQLLAALGEATEPCERCDCCESTEPQGSAEGDRRVGASITHRVFGPGTIISVDDTDARIAFDATGPKTLDLELCESEGLIEFDLPEQLLRD